MTKWQSFKVWFKDMWQAIAFGFVLGVITSQGMYLNSLIMDCKVLGMFRIGTTAFGCQMSKAPA